MTSTEVPPRASSNRRIIPPSVDGLLALLAGIIASDPLIETIYYWPTFVGALLVMSFCNHVLVTIATGGSVGKLLTGLRTVRTSDLEKPAIGQATHRWLWGFLYIAYIPIMVLTGTDMDHLDIAGLRIVRRVDVRRAKG
ncbi:RDD family protein [Nonomuraea maritima]|uniref:RDD family protein n=1 Tax=Nonomuraea maritima TaxID=683260 RepID=A0A1G9HX66_9ACTN|nr:RDD family protein [Nonomuraea maritima]SDL17570.1 RDD family protein [Nonomuraea maritima]